MMLSLAAAFAQAEVAAPGIARQDFLDQAREHLISGRLTATGFPCAVTLDVATLEFEYFELPPHRRQEIPQIEWADLRLSMHWGGMATFGNPDQSPGRMIATRHEVDFAASLYSDVVLMAELIRWTLDGGRHARRSAARPSKSGGRRKSRGETRRKNCAIEWFFG